MTWLQGRSVDWTVAATAGYFARGIGSLSVWHSLWTALFYGIIIFVIFAAIDWTRYGRSTARRGT